MAFEPDVLDAIKARVGLAEVIGRKTRLIRHGREFLALCPFHNEKTPSFRIYEDHYHCFGCGAHGSVFDFVMQAEQLTFPQAVEQLAELAGVTLPRRQDDGERLERDRRKRSLLEVLEQATQYYERMLRLPDGKPALDYLRRRGVDDEAIARFRLGFAPDARGALKAHLAREGATPEQMLEAGLLVQPDDRERAPYDRFRGRVMFPIADRRGRVVGFGGRVIADGQPKYLNSPETALFHKGELLYGLSLATDHARKTGRLIVVEGYMDVIGLGAAGWPETVAPLGTALTEVQIEALWRVTPVPILCFDPDAAGRRAAAGACARALPLLRPGVGLRFAFLRTDTGDDPDGAARRYPQALVRRALADAAPLSKLLVWVETGGRAPASAEARAAVSAHLKQSAQAIRDPQMRAAVLSGAFEALRSLAAGRGDGSAASEGSRRRFPTPPPPAATFADAASFVPASRRDMAERTLLALLLRHPWLFDEVEDAIGAVACAVPERDRLRQALIGLLSDGAVRDRGLLATQIEAAGMTSAAEDALDDPMLRRHRSLAADAHCDDVRDTWRENFDALLDAAVAADAGAAPDESLALRAERRRAALERREP